MLEQCQPFGHNLVVKRGTIWALFSAYSLQPCHGMLHFQGLMVSTWDNHSFWGWKIKLGMTSTTFWVKGFVFKVSLKKVCSSRSDWNSLSPSNEFPVFSCGLLQTSWSQVLLPGWVAPACGGDWWSFTRVGRPCAPAFSAAVWKYVRVARGLANGIYDEIGIPVTHCSKKACHLIGGSVMVVLSSSLCFPFKPFLFFLRTKVVLFHFPRCHVETGCWTNTRAHAVLQYLARQASFEARSRCWVEGGEGCGRFSTTRCVHGGRPGRWEGRSPGTTPATWSAWPNMIEHDLIWAIAMSRNPRKHGDQSRPVLWVHTLKSPPYKPFQFCGCFVEPCKIRREMWDLDSSLPACARMFPHLATFAAVQVGEGRYLLYALQAPSQAAKTSFVKSLLRKPFAATIQGQYSLNLQKLVYGGHEGVILDNLVDWSLVLKHRALLQSNQDMHTQFPYELINSSVLVALCWSFFGFLCSRASRCRMACFQCLPHAAHWAHCALPRFVSLPRHIQRSFWAWLPSRMGHQTGRGGATGFFVRVVCMMTIRKTRYLATIKPRCSACIFECHLLWPHPRGRSKLSTCKRTLNTCGSRFTHGFV